MEISRAHNLYKVTYIRHLKGRGLSVTKSNKKRNGRLFVTKMREFSVGSLVIWDVLTEKRGVFA